MATWRKKLAAIAATNGEVINDLTINISEQELDRVFNDGYGATEGTPFTAWSKNWVYFSCEYDGAEYVNCVPRNPVPHTAHHV